MLSKAEEDKLDELSYMIGQGPLMIPVPLVDWLIPKLKEAETEIKTLNDENNDLCTENTDLVFEMLKLQMKMRTDAEQG